MNESTGEQLEYRGHVLTQLRRRVSADQANATQTVWRITVKQDGIEQIISAVPTLELAKRTVDEFFEG